MLRFLYNYLCINNTIYIYINNIILIKTRNVIFSCICVPGKNSIYYIIDIGSRYALNKNKIEVKCCVAFIHSLFFTLFKSYLCCREASPLCIFFLCHYLIFLSLKLGVLIDTDDMI